MSKRIIIIFLEIMTYAVINAQSYNFSVKETSGGFYTININISTQHISVSQNSRNIFKYKYYSAASDEKGFVGFSFKSNSSPLLRPKRPGHFFIVGSNGIFCNTADDKKAFVFKPTTQNDFIKKYEDLINNINNNERSNIIYVSTSKQFVKALGSNRTIIISDGATINLSEGLSIENYSEKEQAEIESNVNNKILCDSVCVNNFTMIRELHLKDVKNLTIKGQSNNNLVKILTEDSESDVINFENCDGIRLENLIIGHITSSVCLGAVVYFGYSHNISLTNCELFGCGAVGLSSLYSNNILCLKSKIYDCSSSIVDLIYSNKCFFKDCEFYNNGGGLEVREDCYDVEFQKCKFKNNDNEFIRQISNCKVSLKECMIMHDKNKMGNKELLLIDNKTIFQ